VPDEARTRAGVARWAKILIVGYFVVNPFKPTEPMVELIGATLGDGNIYDRKHYVEYTGDPIKDVHYFTHVLLPIINDETGKNPRLFVRDRGLRFRIFSKSFVEWLKKMGIPSGEAKGMAKAPEFIASDMKLMKRCVRGVHDTDGSVYFDMRPAYLRPYPRIELHMKNIDLVNQVSGFFSDIGIAHSYVRTKNSIETSGVDALRGFLRKVGFSNVHHVNRIGTYYPELARENCCPTSLI
jgi:intein/homing endonuclease